MKKLAGLKEKSVLLRIAVHEDDKKQIAEIFERINQAREQLMVCVCRGILELLLILPIFAV